MIGKWSDHWEENREVLDWAALQDLFEYRTNHPSQIFQFDWTGFGAYTPPTASALSLEQHPTEPHAELAAPINYQQQSVLQSGPGFSQAWPYYQTRENNTERDTYRHARMMSMWSEMLEERENRDVLDRAWEVLQDLLECTNNYTSTHDVPAWERHQGFYWTGFDADTPPMASALSLEQHPGPHAELAAAINYQQQSVLQSGPGFSQAWPYYQTQFNNVPTAMPTGHLEVRLAPVGLFKGKVIYGAPGDRVPSPVNVHNSEKRKRESQQDDETPYITKPPNAFMLFREEQRPYVLASHRSTDSATVNTIIGKKWRALSKDKQEKYFQEAKRLRQLHNQHYPDWSAKENYGQKWKRVRKRGPRDD